MISSVDPVDAGYVDSFAHPGREYYWTYHSGARFKRESAWSCLKKCFPRCRDWRSLGCQWSRTGLAFKEYVAAARALKLQLRSVERTRPNPDLTGSVRGLQKHRVSKRLLSSETPYVTARNRIFELATKDRLPSMTEEGRYVDAGGLISYGANLADLYRRAAEYVVEILKGAKPGDLPVKLASKFEIFINLKTSQQLGIVIPQHMLVQADKVIK